MALQQDGAEACRGLLALASAGRIALAIPAFCLVEPHLTMVRRGQTRRELWNRIKPELDQLRRSAHHSSAADVNKLRGLLADAADLDQRSLRDTENHVLAVAEIIDLTRRALVSRETIQREFTLTASDAAVFAGVLAAAESYPGQSIFVSRDTKGFGTPDVREALKRHDARFLGRFEDALAVAEAAPTPNP